MASECRALANLAKSPEVRARMLAVAEQFDRLAGRGGIRETTARIASAGR